MVERRVVILVGVPVPRSLRTLKSMMGSSVPVATSGPNTAAKACADAVAWVFACTSSVWAWRKAVLSRSRDLAIEALNL